MGSDLPSTAGDTSLLSSSVGPRSQRKGLTMKEDNLSSVDLAEAMSSSGSPEESLPAKRRADSASLSVSGKASTVSSNTTPDESSWRHLSQDQRFYLNYHQQHITYYHYFFKHDVYDFVHSSLVDMALEFEPLLYAIIGFSAFHHTVQQPNGKLTTLLRYYDKSISLLRKNLRSKKPFTDATIVTILQLATFEVRALCRCPLDDGC